MLTAIGPPTASAPCEICYCIVRVIGVFIYLLLAFVKLSLFGLAQLGDHPTFLCSCESVYPFNIAWLVLSTGCVIDDRKDVAAVGFYLLHCFTGVSFLLIEVERNNANIFTIDWQAHCSNWPWHRCEGYQQIR